MISNLEKTEKILREFCVYCSLQDNRLDIKPKTNKIMMLKMPNNCFISYNTLLKHSNCSRPSAIRTLCTVSIFQMRCSYSYFISPKNTVWSDR